MYGTETPAKFHYSEFQRNNQLRILTWKFQSSNLNAVPDVQYSDMQSKANASLPVRPLFSCAFHTIPTSLLFVENSSLAVL